MIDRNISGTRIVMLLIKMVSTRDPIRGVSVETRALTTGDISRSPLVG
jgi:hypothetical protein